MNLHYTLPEAERLRVAPLLGEEPIEYCVPYDLTAEGNFCTDGWVVVTKQRLLCLQGDEITQNVSLSDADEILCLSNVDSGNLAVRVNGEDSFLCRFSMRHIVRLSYVARGATLFCREEYRILESSEKERYCPKCGAVLPGTNHCPRCNGGGRTLHRLWDLGSRYVFPLFCLTLFMVANSAFVLWQQFVQRDFIDSVLVPAKGSIQAIAAFFLLMFFIIMSSIVLRISRRALSNRLGTRISHDLRARVFEKINVLSLSFVDKRQAGELMNRVVDDSGQVRMFMEEVFSEMFTQFFTMGGAIVIMLLINPILALLTIAFLPLAAVLVRLFHKREMRLWRQQWRYTRKN